VYGVCIGYANITMILRSLHLTFDERLSTTVVRPKRHNSLDGEQHQNLLPVQSDMLGHPSLDADYKLVIKQWSNARKGESDLKNNDIRATNRVYACVHFPSSSQTALTEQHQVLD
jgi:hypothetical protein